MEIINYISAIAIPFTICIIIIYGVIEKKKVFDVFLKGAKEGIEIVVKIFPTLVGLFVAIGLLRSSGILDLVVSFIVPITSILNVPEAIMPLMILRPISGSASIAIATEIMSIYGVDTLIGLITSTVVGATETTLYTIAVYSSSVGIKKTRFVLWAALAGDLIGMIISVAIWRILS